MHEGGPIFVYTGNEAPITAFWNNSGFLFDIAPKFRALVIFAEHVSDEVSLFCAFSVMDPGFLVGEGRGGAKSQKKGDANRRIGYITGKYMSK